MTPDELDRLADGASPGVWIAFEDEYGYHVENGLHEYTLGRGDTVLADCRLFALAPQLAREHAALLRWADEARALLEQVQYPWLAETEALLAALDAMGGHQ